MRAIRYFAIALILGSIVVFYILPITESANGVSSSVQQDNFGGGCNTFSISAKAQNFPEDLASVKAIDFCKSPSSGDAQHLVDKIIEALKADSLVYFKVQCDGINGANDFVLIDERIDGYRKICSESAGTCRNMFKIQSNSEWYREEELFSRMCDKAIH